VSLKQLLGLDVFPNLKDAEIMLRIRDAQRKQQEVVVFSSALRSVKINVPKVNSEGIMKDF
jgi:hypothetical protein